MISEEKHFSFPLYTCNHCQKNGWENVIVYPGHGFKNLPKASSQIVNGSVYYVLAEFVALTHFNLDKLNVI